MQPWVAACAESSCPTCVDLLPYTRGDGRCGMNALCCLYSSLPYPRGGGRYGLDELYDMADGAGLLLWQEFMFACNPYPNTRDFQEEVGEGEGPRGNGRAIYGETPNVHSDACTCCTERTTASRVPAVPVELPGPCAPDPPRTPGTGRGARAGAAAGGPPLRGAVGRQQRGAWSLAHPKARDTTLCCFWHAFFCFIQSHPPTARTSSPHKPQLPDEPPPPPPPAHASAR